jgi:hypothetical protein
MIFSLQTQSNNSSKILSQALILFRTCLKVWLRLLFKVFSVSKYIKMMFFYFVKNIFKISTPKQSKTYKKFLIFNKKILNFYEIH